MRSVHWLHPVLALLGVSVVVLVAISGLGSGQSRVDVAVSDGAVWLRSNDVGLMQLVDESGFVGRSVQVGQIKDLPDNDFTVVQAGPDAIAVRHDAAAIRRVSLATESMVPDSWVDLAGLGRDASRREIQALFDGEVIWFHSPSDRVAAQLRFDGDRSVTSPPIDIGAASGSAAVHDGELWLLGNDGVVRVFGAFQGEVRSLDVGVGGDGAVMVGTSEGPVVVDPARSEMLLLSSDGVERACDLAAEGPLVDLAAAADGTTVAVIERASGDFFLARDITSDDCGLLSQPVSISGRLGEPVVSGDRAYVPDLDSGRVVVVDGAGTITPVSLTGVDGRPFELIAESGSVFYNDPGSTFAGVVSADLTPRTVVKATQADDPTEDGPLDITAAEIIEEEPEPEPEEPEPEEPEPEVDEVTTEDDEQLAETEKTTTTTSGGTNNGGETGALTAGIKVPAAIYVGEAVVFEGLSNRAGEVAWSWGFGNDSSTSTATSQNPTVTFHSVGMHEVTVHVARGSAEEADSRTTVEVKRRPQRVADIPGDLGLDPIDDAQTSLRNAGFTSVSIGAAVCRATDTLEPDLVAAITVNGNDASAGAPDIGVTEAIEIVPTRAGIDVPEFASFDEYNTWATRNAERIVRVGLNLVESNDDALPVGDINQSVVGRVCDGTMTIRIGTFVDRPPAASGITCRFHDFVWNPDDTHQSWSETWGWADDPAVERYEVHEVPNGGSRRVPAAGGTSHTVVGVTGQYTSGLFMNEIFSISAGRENNVELGNCGDYGGSGWESSPPIRPPVLATGISCRFHDFIWNTDGTHQSWSETWTWAPDENVDEFKVELVSSAGTREAPANLGNGHQISGVTGDDPPVTGEFIIAIHSRGNGQDVRMPRGQLGTCGSYGGSGWESAPPP